MIVLRFGNTPTTHAPRPVDPDTSWCGRPFQGRRRTPRVITRVAGTPTCGRCRMLMWNNARRGQA